MAKGEKLSVKESKFVRAYKLNGGNGTQAVIDAGFETEYPQQYASKLLQKPLIKAELERYEKELDEEFKVSATQKRKWLVQVIERCLQVEKPIDEFLGEEIEAGEFKFNAGEVTRAIAELNKMDGDHAAVKADLGLNGAISQTHDIEGLQSFAERVANLIGGQSKASN